MLFLDNVGSWTFEIAGDFVCGAVHFFNCGIARGSYIAARGQHALFLRAEFFHESLPVLLPPEHSRHIKQ